MGSELLACNPSSHWTFQNHCCTLASDSNMHPVPCWGKCLNGAAAPLSFTAWGDFPISSFPLSFQGSYRPQILNQNHSNSKSWLIKQTLLSLHVKNRLELSLRALVFWTVPSSYGWKIAQVHLSTIYQQFPLQACIAITCPAQSIRLVLPAGSFQLSEGRSSEFPGVSAAGLKPPGGYFH